MGWKITGPGHGFTLVNIDDWPGAVASAPLSVSDVPGDRAGADEIRRVIRGLASVVTATAELRNRYGTGHGRPSRPSGLRPRHARLVVGSSITLVNFLISTWEERGVSA